MSAQQIGRPCRYCGQPMHPPTRDHIRPRARLDQPLGAVNITYVCEACNGDKGARTLIEFLADLIARQDARAERVASMVQSLCARGHHHICGDPRG